ncbi:MAG: MerR family transcriptional regulator [candidate division WOR-3 bacterium]|nr:MerR family transcriptional regulator [candidate division WOR-3 bacterium]
MKKTYYTISEVSEMTDVKPYVLRYWEKEFHELSPRKHSSGRRMYIADDIELIREIKYLLYEREFTISGANKELKSKERNKQLDIDFTGNRDNGYIISQLKDIKKILEGNANEK